MTNPAPDLWLLLATGSAMLVLGFAHARLRRGLRRRDPERAR